MNRSKGQERILYNTNNCLLTDVSMVEVTIHLLKITWLQSLTLLLVSPWSVLWSSSFEILLKSQKDKTKIATKTTENPSSCLEYVILLIRLELIWERDDDSLMSVTLEWYGWDWSSRTRFNTPLQAQQLLNIRTLAPSLVADALASALRAQSVRALA